MVPRFLQMQLDYIFFFYGLAFIFLAATSWALSSRQDKPFAWKWLVLFGFTHGINEWLDMIALDLANTPSFAIVRLIVLIISFLFLLEFGRSGSQALGTKKIGLWIFLPLLLLTGLGSFAGIAGINAAARYSLALPGTLWACLTLWRFRQMICPESRSLAIVIVLLACYGLATGIVVPEAAFFPASVLNYGSFFAFTNFPVQLLRGVLVCAAATFFWQYYCSCRKAAFANIISTRVFRSELWITSTIVLVIIAGWFMTWSFGEHGRREDNKRYTFELTLARTLLEDSVQNADGLTRSLAFSPTLKGIENQDPKTYPAVNATLDRYARIIPGSVCYIMNRDGKTIASSNRNTAKSFVGHSYAFRPYFKNALNGIPDSYIAVGLTSTTPGYYISYPIRGTHGKITGVTVVKLNLDTLYVEPLRNNVGFMVHASGLILASTKPEYYLRTLRPLSENVLNHFSKSKQFQTIINSPVLPAETIPGRLFRLDDQTFQIFMQPTSVKDLSFVLLGSMNTRQIMRLTSIFITLVLTILLITFFVILQRNSEASARIAASEKLYRTLVDGTPNWVGLFDHESRCISININGLKAMGRNTSEVQGRLFSEIWSMTADSRLHDAVKQVLEGHRISFETEQSRPIGSPTTWYVVLNPIFDQNNNVSSFVGIATDISLLKQAEAEKAQLEAINRQLQKAESLSLMAGAIAHHFNNQLGVVIGNLEMVIEDFSGNPEIVKMLNDAMESSSKAVEISSLMLTYLGQTPGKPEPLDLSQTCRRNLLFLKATIPENVTFDINLPMPGPTIYADKNEIQQVLTNLVANAREAVEKNQGYIGLTVKVVSADNIPTEHFFPVDWQPESGHYACLEVTDEGSGIADKDIENLFDPFFSNKFTGRGLGLSAVQGIARANNGVVTVHSEEGIGSTFRVFFPLFDEKDTA